MNQEKMQEIALMRYSAIAPLITGLQDDYSSLEDFFHDASLKGVTAPDGSIKHYAPGTIEKWYRSYKQDDSFWNLERLSNTYPQLSMVDLISIVDALASLSDYIAL
jgi:hypothetical protein